MLALGSHASYADVGPPAHLRITEREPGLFNVQNDVSTVRLDGWYRFGKKHRIAWTYWSTSRDGVSTYDGEPIDVGDITINPGDSVTISEDSTLFAANWTYSFLNTAKYPEAVFILERVSMEGKLANANNAQAKLYGSFTLHGVTRKISLDVTISHRVATPAMEKLGIKGDVLRIKGSFTVKMSDYGIKVPSKLGAKVSNTVKLNLALTAFTG